MPLLRYCWEGEGEGEVTEAVWAVLTSRHFTCMQRLDLQLFCMLMCCVSGISSFYPSTTSTHMHKCTDSRKALYVLNMVFRNGWELCAD